MAQARGSLASKQAAMAPHKHKNNGIVNICAASWLVTRQRIHIARICNSHRSSCVIAQKRATRVICTRHSAAKHASPRCCEKSKWQHHHKSIASAWRARHARASRALA